MTEKKPKRVAIVEFSFEIPVEVDSETTDEELELFYNESCWCADNALKLLEQERRRLGCLCPCAWVKVVRVMRKRRRS